MVGDDNSQEKPSLVEIIMPGDIVQDISDRTRYDYEIPNKKRTFPYLLGQDLINLIDSVYASPNMKRDMLLVFPTICVGSMLPYIGDIAFHEVVNHLIDISKEKGLGQKYEVILRIAESGIYISKYVLYATLLLDAAMK